MTFDRFEKIEIGAIAIIIIIVFSFLLSRPNPDFNSSILDFSLDEESDTFRTGYPITFKWEIMGNDPQTIVNWGDGNVETFINRYDEETGGFFKITTHTYLLQGKYFPKLQIWNDFGKIYLKSCEVTIQNDILQFNINITPSYQIFEDEEVLISIENVFDLNKGLRRDSENLIYLYDFGDSQLTSNKSHISHAWKNEGNYPLTISVIDSQGTISRKTTSIEVKNKPPEAKVRFLGEDLPNGQFVIKVSAEDSIDTKSDKNSLRYLWDWGDNITSWGKFTSHLYQAYGYREITLHVIDDNGATDNYTFSIIVDTPSVIKKPNTQTNIDANYPYIAIGTLPTEVFEDEIVQLVSEITLQEGNIADYATLWAFGDGTSSFERAPLHAWTHAGIYDIELKVTDVNGYEYLRYDKIIVKEKPPEILGPFSFQGIEGKAINLDVEVYDSIYDEPKLKYKWYDENDQLFSTSKKPSVILDDGEYKYTLEVIDLAGLITTREINVLVHPISPEIFIPNFVYYGNDPGLIELRAYFYDNVFDIPELNVYWTIRNGKSEHQLVEVNNGNYSKTTFECYETTIYQGEIRIYDRSGNSRVKTFQIFSYVNTPKTEGNKEELYEFLGLKLAAPQDFGPDTDGDHLSDQYEIDVSNTSIYNHDTDGDGLWDGYDDFGIGEKTLGTSPTNSDSDGDQLNDGMEYFGYEISINYFENASTFRVSSDPLSVDTELDGVSDFEEFKAKTNPRLVDSDGDQLFDRNDPYPTTWDYDQDLLSDFMEKRLGTELDNADSDQDGLKDGDEVNGWGILQFQTDPTYADTDQDFAIDSAELKNYKVTLKDEYGKERRVNLTEPVSLHFPHFFTKAATAQISFALSFGEQGSDEIQTYGIDNSSVLNLEISIIKTSDDIVLYNSITNTTRHFSQVVDITEIMNDEQQSLNYYGEYLLEVKEVNDNSIPGCLLEQFELDFTRFLDPNNPDFDGDGIFDGVEMDLLVRGTDRIDSRDFYNSSDEGMQYQNEEKNEFSLKIPDRGRVYDAKITMEIVSEKSLEGKGNVYIKLVKKIGEWEPELLTHQENFDIHENYFYKTTIDLSSFFKFGYLGVYSGEYILKMNIQDTNSNDTFYISEFYIETDTYIQAGYQDAQAWLTDPALSDSDSDGWSDSYEIFTSSTNPLNKDTDGDNAWDPNDRDPLRNVMLEIRPISGTFVNQYWPWPSPTLEMVIRFHINDLIDPDFSEDRNRIGFCTAPKLATTTPNWWGANQITWWNSGEGHQYYFDISDDVTIQSNEIPFYFQLWQMVSITGDVPIFAGAWLSDMYSISNVGHSEELTVYMNGDNLRCNIETIAIERANTIAIFDSNSTSFTGHYNNEERMNIIQLHVTEEGQGTPFKKGPNNIIIPTSLFEKTILNSYLQNEQLEETPLYSDQEGLFEFYSIDRDGNIIDDQCGDTDFLFVRYDITQNEAMEVLNSLLTCAVNQSLDENNKTITELDLVYEYVSTKLNQISAVSLNLPKGILSFIPWISSQINSPFGRTPVALNFWGLMLTGLLTLVSPMTGMVMVIFFTAVLFSIFFADIAEAIGLTILTFLAKLLWILIRVALLILFYILLAIELLTTSLIFVSIGLIFSSFSTLSCNWGLDFAIPYSKNKKIAFIDLKISEHNISFEAYIEWIYWEFFDIFCPLLTMNTDQTSMLDKISNLTSVESSPPELACGWIHVEDLIYDFHVDYRQRPEGYPPKYVKLVLISPQSKEEFEFLMEETQGQQFEDYYDFVRFNYTVDFKDFDLKERQGQWYYCFVSEASVINSTRRWPYYGYAIAPLINDLKYYFISSYLEPRSGLIIDDFTFSAMGGDFIDNNIPTIVRLNILWPNETLQSFNLDKISTFTLGKTDLNTYEKTINFSNYLAIDKRVELKYNFEAVFQDGKVAVLWDTKTIDENTNVDDDLNNFTYENCWFEGPIIYPPYSGEPHSPIIRDWYVEDLTWDRVWNKGSIDRVLNPVSNEFILRFYIYIEDPDGNHEDHYRNGYQFIPKLLLTNLDSPLTPMEPIDMKWTGGNYGPGPEEYDEYFVDIIGSGYYAYKYENRSDLIKCDFGPGAWNFSFQVTDNQSHTVLENSNKKLWHIGSFENMQNTLFYGHTTPSGIGGLVGSIITTIAYIAMAVLASCQNQALQIAAQIIAAGLLILDLSMNIYSLIKFTFETEDPGALLGLGLNLLIKSCGFLISLELSKNKFGGFNFNFLSMFASVTTAFTILNLMNEVTSFNLEVDENGEMVLTEDESNPSFDTLLGGYPSMLLSFLTSIIGLTTSLFITSGYSKIGGGSDGVSKVIIFHTILSFVMSIMCIFMFLEKSGYFHIANDLDYSNMIP